jgi:hypothetical protein
MSLRRRGFTAEDEDGQDMPVQRKFDLSRSLEQGIDSILRHRRGSR